jgi:hypothetical protein
MRLEKQIEQFYAKWSPALLAFCCLLLGEGSEAEQTTVEAFHAYLSRGLDLDVSGLPAFLFLFAIDAAKRATVSDTGRHGRQRDYRDSGSRGSEGLDERVAPPAPIAAQGLFLREKEMKVAIWKFTVRIAAASSWFTLLASASGAQQTSLALEQALDMARTRAPVILSARARIEEARGRLKGASVLFQQNPSIEADVGPRLSRPNHFTDVDVALTQEFELGGRRRARIAGAEAGIARETADSGEATRRLLREVASSFSRALAAQERVRLLATAETLAQEFLQIAERRYRAGDVAILEVNLSRTILAAIPVAFVGSILALLVSGETWNVSSLVGLIGLFGIAVQNGLVLVTQTRSLLAEGKPLREAIREASIGRARPKLMTASTAICGLLPILLLRMHGTEIERPLAIVITGGLVTSTVFILLVLPTIYPWFVRRTGGERAQ